MALAAVKAKPKGKAEVRGRSATIISPVVRASFPHIEKPNSGGNFPSNKYEITCLIEKKREPELKAMKQACLEAARQVWPEVKFNDLEHPFKDGDQNKLDSYHGHISFKAKSDRKPGVVGPDKLGLPEGVEVYGGCYVRISCVAFTYTRTVDLLVEKGGKRSKVQEDLKGVSLSLSNVQFVRDGERFGGSGSSPQQDFDEISPSELEEIVDGGFDGSQSGVNGDDDSDSEEIEDDEIL